VSSPASPPPRAVRWTERAQKDLCALDARTRRRVVAAVDRLAETGQGDVRRLQGVEQEAYRLRVGDVRVVFAYDDGALVLLVLRVAHRREVYRRR